jgi:hypothetical protein
VRENFYRLPPWQTGDENDDSMDNYRRGEEHTKERMEVVEV